MPQDRPYTEEDIEALSAQAEQLENDMFMQDVDLSTLEEEDRMKLSQSLSKMLTQVTGEDTKIDAMDPAAMARSLQAAADLFSMLVDADILPEEAFWDLSFLQSPQGYMQIMARLRMLLDDKKAIKKAKAFLEEPEEGAVTPEEMPEEAPPVQEDVLEDDVFMSRM